MAKRKVVLTGGAGLVGQNLVTHLEGRRDLELTVIDKHRHNLEILHTLHPSVGIVLADLAEPGPWETELAGADTLVQLHAQVTALDEEPFRRNNVVATKRVLAAAEHHGVPFLVHVSSMVVESAYDADPYSRTKREQERLVVEGPVPHCVLRPVLMFGWFDPKHLGWLAGFMQRAPVFPIPGRGRFGRQPLYVRDFCRVLGACIDRRPTDAVYDIVGPEHVDYVDIIRAIRATKHLRTPIVPVPIALFAVLLRIYAAVDRHPPFTVDQLKALVAGDAFQGVDLEAAFGVRPTPFAIAIRETFEDPRYAGVVLRETSDDQPTPR